jgi:hypothetical protein
MQVEQMQVERVCEHLRQVTSPTDQQKIITRVDLPNHESQIELPSV